MKLGGCGMSQGRTHDSVLYVQTFPWMDIYECVQFGADLNKNKDLLNLNVAS